MNRCENVALVECIEKYKKKLLKKPYPDDSAEAMVSVLTETNKEHQKILELLQASDADGVCTYLSDVHWRRSNAEFDMI